MKQHQLIVVNFMSLNLFLLLIIFSNNVYCHEPIKFFKSEIQKTFKNSPKTWHSYVKMFIYKYLKGNDYFCNTFIMNRFRILKYSWIFLKVKDKSSVTRTPKNGFKSHHIKWPSGQVFIIY